VLIVSFSAKFDYYLEHLIFSRKNCGSFSLFSPHIPLPSCPCSDMEVLHKGSYAYMVALAPGIHISIRGFMQTSAKCMSQGQEGRGMFPLLVWAPFGSPAQSLPPSDVGRLAVKSGILPDLPAVSLSRMCPVACRLVPEIPAPDCRISPGQLLPLRGRLTLPLRGRLTLALQSAIRRLSRCAFAFRFAQAPLSLRHRFAVPPLARK